MSRVRSQWVALFAISAALGAGTAEGSERDRVEPETARRTPEERTFVFGLDPNTPSRGVVTAESSLGLGSGVAALRPLPAASDAHVPETSLTMSLGLGGGLAPFVTGVRAFGEGAASSVGVVAGLRWQLTEAGAPLRVGLVGAAFREPGGAYGMSLRGAVTYDVERLRLGSNVLAERAFPGGRGARDALDVVVSAGASYRVLPGLRLGAEYVGQDLEELGGPGAEGGAKQYAGPTTAIELDRGRVQIVAGPAIGLGGNSARWLGRASVVFSF